MFAASPPSGTRLLLRADASPQMGTGHVMRCLALAQAWMEGGGRVRLLSEELPPLLAERLRSEGLELCALPPGEGAPEQAARCAALAEGGPVVVDGYHLGALGRELRGLGQPLLCLDDYGMSGLSGASWVLDQNLGADPAAYGGLGARLLCGPRWALLRREFWALPAARAADEGALRLLISMGGADPPNTSLSALEALQALSGGLRLTLLVGAANPHLPTLSAYRSRHPLRLVQGSRDVAGLMMDHDLAISAAGSTVWELMRCGLPALLVPIADNQLPALAHVEAAGVARLVRGLEQLPALVEEMIEPALRRDMAARGPALVDGQGARRVAAELWGAGALSAIRP